MSFENKVALVTGGSRGLGREMVLAFAREGADVVIASRKLENCEAVAAEVEALGRRALPVACHVGHWVELGDLADRAYEEFGKVDILVNNAGMSPLYPSLEEVSEELFDKIIGVNLKGPYRLSAIVGSRMAAGDGGVILNISSTGSIHPSPNAEPYGAAKAGLNALTRSLAFAYRPKVRVNCILAGPFLTDISKAWDMEAFERNASSSIALGRGGEPDEIVGAALYLCSDAASFTNAALISVDGGGR
ncbi:MAG: SDR family oxidoreductase [Acidobacteriota bacterium]|nr:SDR family oxidoreductase [Acidobacteriota bacterium]